MDIQFEPQNNNDISENKNYAPVSERFFLIKKNYCWYMIIQTRFLKYLTEWKPFFVFLLLYKCFLFIETYYRNKKKMLLKCMGIQPGYCISLPPGYQLTQCDTYNPFLWMSHASPTATTSLYIDIRAMLVIGFAYLI